MALSTDLVVRAWVDPIFRSELTEEDLRQLPDHPAGSIDGLGEAEFLQPVMWEPVSWETQYECCVSGEYIWTDDPGCASQWSWHPCCY
jgi:mersacidin/lichenicidin family type 2 lantibiotic